MGNYGGEREIHPSIHPFAADLVAGLTICPGLARFPALSIFQAGSMDFEIYYATSLFYSTSLFPCRLPSICTGTHIHMQCSKPPGWHGVWALAAEYV